MGRMVFLSVILHFGDHFPVLQPFQWPLLIIFRGRDRDYQFGKLEWVLSQRGTNRLPLFSEKF